MSPLPLWIWGTEAFRGCNAPVTWKPGQQTLEHLGHFPARELCKGCYHNQSVEFRNAESMVKCSHLDLCLCEFLFSHFTTDLCYRGTKLRGVWSWSQNALAEGVTQEEVGKSCFAKSQWITMHYTGHDNSAAVKLSNTSYSEQLNGLLAKGIERKRAKVINSGWGVGLRATETPNIPNEIQEWEKGSAGGLSIKGQWNRQQDTEQQLTEQLSYLVLECLTSTQLVSHQDIKALVDPCPYSLLHSNRTRVLCFFRIWEGEIWQEDELHPCCHFFPFLLPISASRLWQTGLSWKGLT